MATWTIYLLRDPDQPIGYVGQTRRDPRVRFRAHLSQAKQTVSRARSGKIRWLQRLADDGRVPELIELQTCASSESANDAEARWIAHYRDSGLQMMNCTVGGQGVYPRDFGTRISEALKRPESQARKSRASREIARKTWADPDVAARRIANSTRAKQTGEYGAKILASWRDPAVRTARVETLRATLARPEVSARRSEIQRRLRRRPEARRLVAEHFKQLSRDPEYRARRGWPALVEMIT